MRDEETSGEKYSPVSISIFIFNFLNIFEGKSTIKRALSREFLPYYLIKVQT